MKEEKMLAIGKLIAFERKINIGPASAVCFGGFFEALKKGLIQNGQSVMINIGEGVRRAPDFVEQMIYTTKIVDSLDECEPHLLDDYRKQLWDDVLND